ncbi:hypothetical protein ANN_20010 [Periplaneta americana]|uniref:Uncharacterized protein n=1 Tax=Periplaneta americana TaxID=6978 RepID=A0ABQ8SBG9_PERAM|nr:hypothetical protein ANN_20010 [Periplaneta americana]
MAGLCEGGNEPPGSLKATLYGAEAWTLRRNEEKQIEAFEMWIRRRMERVKWTDLTEDVPDGGLACPHKLIKNGSGSPDNGAGFKINKRARRNAVFLCTAPLLATCSAIGFRLMKSLV